MAITVTQASLLTGQTAFGHQVQAGAQEGPPPGSLLQGRATQLRPGRRGIPKAPEPRAGVPPTADAPHSPPQPAAPRGGRKCVTRPRRRRAGAGASRRCSGPAPCAGRPWGSFGLRLPFGLGWGRYDSEASAGFNPGVVPGICLSKAAGETRFGVLRTGSVGYTVSKPTPPAW